LVRNAEGSCGRRESCLNLPHGAAGKAGTTLKSLMEADDVAYTVNTELSYTVPLS
jgi:hypothetical protein